jgi:hypothetical protein
MIHLLNELSNAGVTVSIYCPKQWTYAAGTGWTVNLTKEADGTELKISARDENLEWAVQSAYDKWLKASPTSPSSRSTTKPN